MVCSKSNLGMSHGAVPWRTHRSEQPLLCAIIFDGERSQLDGEIRV
jgi:hypothetical protein